MPPGAAGPAGPVPCRRHGWFWEQQQDAAAADSAAGGRLCSGSAALALSLEGALGQSQLLT